MADAKLMADWEEMEGLSNLSLDDDNNADDKDEDDASFRPALASNLQSSDVYYEMEKRGLKSTGFQEIDKEFLQKAFDEEFKADLEDARARRREVRRRAVQQSNLKRRRLLMEKTLHEEQEELAKAHQISMMIDLIKENETADTMKIDVNSVSARSLAKAMCSNTSITCLDLSASQLNDNAGSYLARILKRNSTLRKIELDNNFLGPKTCQAFGESLKINTSLTYLSLDSNPLTSDGEDFTGISALVESLSTSTSVKSINLWRTGLRSQGGLLVANALENNDTLLFCDIGHNGIDMCDMKRIANKLDINLSSYEMAERRRREQALADSAQAQKLVDIEEAKKKQKNLEEWLATSRAQRAENKRVAEEKRLELERRELEEIQRLQEVKRQAEHKAAEEAAAKKQKKKDKAAKKK